MPDSNERTYKYECDHGDCKYKTSRYDMLIRHKTKHTGEKPHECDICGFKCSRSDKLLIHKRRHTGEKTHECDYKGCGYKFATSDQLIRHKRRHTGDKPYKCNDCNFKCSRSDVLAIHKRKHTGEKPYECGYKGCGYKFSTSGQLVTHKRTHTGEKPYNCNVCNFKCSRSDILINHKRTHTIAGQIHRKTQENNLKNKIEKWGFTVDTETTINAKRGGCLNDTNRYYSRIDYHVINCTNAILLIECDEDQHSWYEISCEFSRMSDVRASLMTAGYELPIYWIRYNPNGKYHIGGERVKFHRPEREIALKAKLEELCSPDFVPDKQVNIHYMFYDLMSEELGPEIMIESDFPEHLQDCVTWH